MAKAWHYPRWRRILMQSALWMILGATVGVAAVVVREKRSLAGEVMGPVQTFGGVSLRLPSRWLATGERGSILLVAREPRSGRSLIIRRQHVRGNNSPSEFLLSVGILQGTFPLSENDDSGDGESPVQASGSPVFKPIKIAGWPGVMTSIVRERPGETVLQRELIACTITPARTTLVMQLVSPQPEGAESDEALLRRIADSMKLNGELPAQRQASLLLSNGLRLQLPSDFVLHPQPDPNRTNRLIVQEAHGSRHAIELIPCLKLEGDNAERDVPAMLLAHTPALAGSSLSVDAQGLWRVKWPGLQHSNLTAAKVIPGHGEASALVLLLGSDADDVEFRSALSFLEAGAKAERPVDYPALVAAGDARAQKLGETGLENLLASDRSEKWWSLRDAGATAGWMHQSAGKSTSSDHGAVSDDAALFSQQREWRWLLSDKRIAKVSEKWNGSADLRQYQYEMRDTEADAGEEDGSDVVWKQVSAQATMLNDGKLSTRSSGENPDEAVEETAQPTPAAFVPGGWLQQVMGQVDQPMVLRVESFCPASQGAALSATLKLLVTPGGPEKKGSAGNPLRCISIEVTGTGTVARWYFRVDGTLDSVDYPDGLSQVRSDLANIRFDFLHKPGMIP